MSVPKIPNNGSAVIKSASILEKIDLSNVSKPSWLPPRGSVEVSHNTSSKTGNVGGISHAPSLRVILAVILQTGVNPVEVLLVITTLIFSSFETVDPEKVYAAESSPLLTSIHIPAEL